VTTTRDASAWHLVGLVAPVAILSGNLAGGAWTLSGVVWMLVVYPVLDVVSGTGRPASVTYISRSLLAGLPYVHVILQGCVFATLIWRVQLDGYAWTTWIAALSCGLNTGISAIVVAHEMGHSRSLTFRWWLARLNLLTAMYLHFTLEHNRQHHPAHHLSPSLPFWQLDLIEGAPTLPTGYYGLFWPCLFPPLWKRWIDPRIPTTP